MKCNAGELSKSPCASDPAASRFLFDADTVSSLQAYQFIFVPGGDFDFFSEVRGLCEGQPSQDFNEFLERYPVIGARLKKAIIKDICPFYERNDTVLYDTLMGAFQEYVYFFRDHKIPHKWLAYYLDQPTAYVGDRVRKIDMLAATIDLLELQNTGSDKKYVLLGHSLGGLNVADFLVELVGGHAPGTPEYRLFEHSKVRQWPAEKKRKVFNKIKGAAFLNTFLQGDGTPEAKLLKIAKQDGLSSADPVDYYIEYILKNYPAGTMPDTARWKQIVSYTLLTSRYRVNYYLKDRNTLARTGGRSIQAAFDLIADRAAIISIGCAVSREFSGLRAKRNFLEHMSRRKWQNDAILNDGMVDTCATIFPRPSADYAILYNKDHGTLVLKPHIPGISGAYSYDQIPFIKTLLKAMDSKMKEIQERDRAGRVKKSG